MSAAKQEFLSPVGRMVQGNPFEKQTKDQMGNLLTVKTGPNAGQPTQRYFCAVAFAKNDPAFPAFYALLASAARTGFPTLFDAQGNCLSRDFSWKLADGDSTQVSKPGETPNASKEGFPGHWVVKFSSSFPPRVFYVGKYAPHEQITDPNVLRRGYFVRIAGTVEGNNNPQRPGIYVNLSMVEFAGVGTEITSGPDANAIFGGTAVQLPAGAQPLPMHAGNGQPQAMPGLPGMPLPMAGPGPGVPSPAMPTGAYLAPMAPTGYPAPTAGPSSPGMPMPGMAVMPNPGILAGPGMTAPPMMPAPGGMPMPMPAPIAPAAPQMTAKAGGYTYEQLRANGFDDAGLRAQGYML